jgi:GABA(A) receptor-associated protein
MTSFFYKSPSLVSSVKSTSTANTANTANSTATISDNVILQGIKGFIQPPSFKDKFSFEERKNESEKIRHKFSGRYPIIIERSPLAKDIPVIDKQKFLVPGDFTFGQFIAIIRKRLEIPSDKAIFIFINNSLAPLHKAMRELYFEHADTDGFMYCLYTGESTFG